jgi:hypothetical protein
MISPFYLHFSSIVGDPVETPTKRPRNALQITKYDAGKRIAELKLTTGNKPSTWAIPGRYLDDPLIPMQTPMSFMGFYGDLMGLS